MQNIDQDIGSKKNSIFPPKIAENCRKLPKIAENCRKLPKVAENCRK
jgi:ribosomal protein L40E